MPPPKSDIAGLVLTGGQSRRMGRDKATVTIGDLPLWRIAVDILKPLTDTVFLVGQASSLSDTAPHKLLADAPPGLGPLGGIATGLEQSGYQHHLVIAVDYPLVRPDLLRLFLKHADVATVVCGQSRDYVEPLVAYYHASCAPVMRQMIDEGEIRTHMVLERTESRIISSQEYDAVDPDRLSQINVNTPEQLEKVRRLYPDFSGE